MITCPGCRAVLRQVAGLHQAGEPYMQHDEQGTFMICLKCETKVRWKDDDPPPSDFDLGDDTALA